jgi:FixJ family two-component response regulator
VDFIEKPFSDMVLLDRIREAMSIDEKLRSDRGKLDEIHRRMERLTRREAQVLEMVVAGKLNKQIAGELGLSHKTIEVHRAHVMEKMEAASLAELVRMFVAVQDTAVPSHV